MSRLSCVQNCICPDYRAFIFFPDRVILNARRHLVRSFRSGDIDFRSGTSTWVFITQYVRLLRGGGVSGERHHFYLKPLLYTYITYKFMSCASNVLSVIFTLEFSHLSCSCKRTYVYRVNFSLLKLLVISKLVIVSVVDTGKTDHKYKNSL